MKFTLFQKNQDVESIMTYCYKYEDANEKQNGTKKRFHLNSTEEKVLQGSRELWEDIIRKRKKGG